MCDLEKIFREQSPGGCIGWELMDDHVHPTMRGQALMAEAFVKKLHELKGAAAISDAQFARIKPWEEYSRELGENAYDQYGVDYTMFVLFNVEFMRERNPCFFDRLRRLGWNVRLGMKKYLLLIRSTVLGQTVSINHWRD